VGRATTLHMQGLVVLGGQQPQQAT